MPNIPTVALPSGETVPALGQGTWNMGQSRAHAKEEIAALRLGVELGQTLIDTAEMYGDGGAEELIGEALAGTARDSVFLVSKVLPRNASRRAAIAACEASLKRLKTDRLDLYLLHWRGGTALTETLEGFAALRKSGKIRFWGVSNFDFGDMEELADLPGGADAAANQVMYNLKRRGIEYDLVPWCRARAIPIMAYSPLDQGRLLGAGAVKQIALAHGVSPASVALAWLLRKPQTMVIPKAGSILHVRENHAALALALSPDDLAALDRAFPPPRTKQALEST
jgi:diketogulonate reductase-like aldo/keto reductase